MKSFLQAVAFVLIIIGGFWVGMQWGSSARHNVSREVDSRNTQISTPVTVVPVIVPEQSENSDVVNPEVAIDEPQAVVETAPIPVSNTSVDPNLPTKITDKMNHYSNSNFRYEFDIPANVYYAWFGAADGARHTVGIGKEDPETLADAAVRVYFYGKKIVPELQNASNGKYIDPAGKYVYVLIDGGYSVKIEALNINHPVVQKILETIQVF